MRNSLYLIISLFFLNSCAFHTGMMTSSASLTDGNFKVVQFASGEVTTRHFFGIGGLKKDAVVKEAKQDLLRKYPLKRGQVLANVTVDVKRTYFLMVITTKTTVSADIVQFGVFADENEFDAINDQNITMDKSSVANFNVKDSVFIYTHNLIKRAEIVGFPKNRVRVLFFISGDNLTADNVNLSHVFKMKSNPQNVQLYGYDVDERVQFIGEDKNLYDAVIFGINSYQAGLKYDIGENDSFKWKMIPLAKLRKL